MHYRVRNWGCQSHEVMNSCHFPIAVEHAEYFQSSFDTSGKCFIVEHVGNILSCMRLTGLALQVPAAAAFCWCKSTIIKTLDGHFANRAMDSALVAGAAATWASHLIQGQQHVPQV